MISTTKETTRFILADAGILDSTRGVNAYMGWMREEWGDVLPLSIFCAVEGYAEKRALLRGTYERAFALALAALRGGEGDRWCCRVAEIATVAQHAPKAARAELLRLGSNAPAPEIVARIGWAADRAARRALRLEGSPAQHWRGLVWDLK